MLKIERRKALIGVINTRAENHGDEHVPGVDIPVKFQGKADKFLPMFIRGATDSSVSAFWTEDGNTRFPSLKPLKVSGKFENVEMAITEEELEERVVTTLHEGNVGDITLKPLNDGMLEINFKYQCRPGDNDWKNLMHLMKEECFVQLTERQQSLDLDGEEETEEGEAA